MVVHADHQLVAPNAIRSDAMQLLLNDVRRGLRTDKDVLDTHERITRLRIRLFGDRVSRGLAWRIAIEQDWGRCEMPSTLRSPGCRPTLSSRLTRDERPRSHGSHVVAPWRS